MARLFERMFGGLPAQPVQPIVMDELESEQMPVRYRPRLISQLLQDHENERAQMRDLLDACRERNEDKQIVCLRNVAATVRRVGLAKAVQLYPYLRWGLDGDRIATIQFKAVHAEAQRSLQAADAILCEYLDGPWMSDLRRRLVTDVARLARVLGQAMRHEEASVFPLYLSPGQYRHLRSA